MTINAPVHARIITPDDVHDLVKNNYYVWMWGDFDYAPPPSHDEMCVSFRTAFSDDVNEVIFMVAYELPGGVKNIDFIVGEVTMLKYESAREGMLVFEMKTDDKRWTKINGFLNCMPQLGQPHGWMSITPRRDN